MLDHSVLPQSSTKAGEMKNLPYVTTVRRTFLTTRYHANGVPPTELRAEDHVIDLREKSICQRVLNTSIFRGHPSYHRRHPMASQVQ